MHARTHTHTHTHTHTGYLSSWFRHHVDLLQAVLPMILNALSQPSLAPSAALAFRDLCGECAEMLVPVAVQLIPACQVGVEFMMSVIFFIYVKTPSFPAGISLPLLKLHLPPPPSFRANSEISKILREGGI